LHFFRDIADYQNFGMFPLDQITEVGVSRSTNLKLIIFEVFQKTYLNVTDGQTDPYTPYSTMWMPSYATPN